jgi:glycerol-3-phosphate dehydrogenase (NAD(P)+)
MAVRLLGGRPETPYWLPGVGDMFVTSAGGRNVRVGRMVRTGRRFSQARERLGGITLEGAAAIQVIGCALPADFPLMRHLHAVVAKDEPVRMPWNTFFGGEA